MLTRKFRLGHHLIDVIAALEVAPQLGVGYEMLRNYRRGEV